MSKAVVPFQLAVPEAELSALRARLAATRWPEAETVGGWNQGVPLARARDLIEYWRTRYDWRVCESKLNAFGQCRTEIDGLGIHFLHARSPHANALPLLITHGWPGSVVEFHKIIGPLCDPVPHGGSADDAFTVIAPSLPGFGFSDRPASSGWGVDRIAAAWAQLMQRLGYSRYVAQGGDWGSAVTVSLAKLRPAALAGIHITMVLADPISSGAFDADEQDALEARRVYATAESGYARQQATRPQTLGYGLADSPAGQAMWIYEKFERWSDCAGDPETVFSRDELLDNIMLYWLPNTGTSSARLYWESMASFKPTPLDLPVGCSIFPREIARPPRKWVETLYPNLFYWNRPDHGGHFAAFERPEIFVQELRNCFRKLR